MTFSDCLRRPMRSGARRVFPAILAASTLGACAHVHAKIPWANAPRYVYFTPDVVGFDTLNTVAFEDVRCRRDVATIRPDTPGKGPDAASGRGFLLHDVIFTRMSGPYNPPQSDWRGVYDVCRFRLSTGHRVRFDLVEPDPEAQDATGRPLITYTHRGSPPSP